VNAAFALAWIDSHWCPLCEALRELGDAERVVMLDPPDDELRAMHVLFVRILRNSSEEVARGVASDLAALRAALEPTHEELHEIAVRGAVKVGARFRLGRYFHWLRNQLELLWRAQISSSEDGVAKAGECEQAAASAAAPSAAQTATSGTESARRHDEFAEQQLAAIPALDERNGQWARVRDASKIDSVSTATLNNYRSEGWRTPDGCAGIDSHGRVWRKPGPNAQTFYFRASLKNLRAQNPQENPHIHHSEGSTSVT
jgi:hypothetical protein